MLTIYDVESARSGILKRQPLEDTPVSNATLERIKNLFGEALSPEQVVDRILAEVRKKGDSALLEWTQKLDSPQTKMIKVSPQSMESAWDWLPEPLRQALVLSAERVRKFHQAQPVTSWMTQSMGGTLGQFVRPIRRVGLYIPAGTAPLPSTVIMTAVPAQVAGVPEIVLVAPPQRESGQVDPLILATAHLLRIKEMYAIGGAQAIAALAYGTESIPRLTKFLVRAIFCHPGKTQSFWICRY